MNNDVGLCSFSKIEDLVDVFSKFRLLVIKSEIKLVLCFLILGY